MRQVIACAALAVLLPLSACQTVDSAADGVKSVGSTVAHGVASVPSLVNVNLSNVLNNLALDLKIDKANIPINAQIPINIAANVCGVSINVLSIGAGGGSSKGCTANSISPELKQYIQEQLAANGSVGGGAQTTTGETGQPASTTPAVPPATGTTGTTGTVSQVPPNAATTNTTGSTAPSTGTTTTTPPPPTAPKS